MAGQAIDLYKKTIRTELSLYSRSYRGVAPGIGGLEVNFASNLRLQPNNLSYRDGFLIANVPNKQPIQIPVAKEELKEIIGVVQKNNSQYSLQTSIDQTVTVQTTSGADTYFSSAALRETHFLKDLFHRADLEFAQMVYENIPPSRVRNVAPNEESFALLDTDNSYRQLPKNWIKQPYSYPQLFISFNPEMTGL